MSGNITLQRFQVLLLPVFEFEHEFSPIHQYVYLNYHELFQIALIDQEGNIRSRIDENGNPIIYYNGLEDSGIQMLKEDIKLLL